MSQQQHYKGLNGMKPKDYLQDPDEQIEQLGRISSEPVQARNKDQADSKCEELAASYGLKLESTTKRDKDWYDCNFRG